MLLSTLRGACSKINRFQRGKFPFLQWHAFVTAKEDNEYYYYRHFRQNKDFHPLNKGKELADSRALLHPIWTKEELDCSLSNLQYNQPRLRSALYHSFNFIAGYEEDNPTVKWSLIIVESVNCGYPSP